MERKRAAGTRSRCLFCGAAGVTKEHIFARSLTKMFDISLPTGVQAVVRHEQSHPEEGVHPHVKQANTFAYKARKFCGRCNSGWMARVDRDASTSLMAFARVQPMTLNPSHQQPLALWASKIALAFQAIAAEGHQYAESRVYHEVYRTQQPPVRSQIWLGATTRQSVFDETMAAQRSHSVSIPTATGRVRGFGSVIVFGSGVLFFVYHGVENHAVRLRNEAHLALRRIWPVQQGVQWPPGRRITPHRVPVLSELVNANSQLVPLGNAETRPGGAGPLR